MPDVLKKPKKKNYKRRSKTYKFTGTALTGLTTAGGFVAYESMIDWNNFKQEMGEFVVISQESVKLNMAIALPFLISIIVFLFVMMKKNREFFKDKVSMNLLIAICIFYLVFSVIEATLAALIGAFAGSVFDEFIFSPLSKSAKAKAEEEHEIDLEVQKETRRILARKISKEEEQLNGSV